MMGLRSLFRFGALLCFYISLPPIGHKKGSIDLTLPVIDSFYLQHTLMYLHHFRAFTYNALTLSDKGLHDSLQW